VSKIDDPLRSLIATGFPFKGGPQVDEYLRILPRIMRETSGIRRPGAASLDLAQVACGRFEGFWSSKLSPWDIAAEFCSFVRQAGRHRSCRSTGESRANRLVTGNPKLHEWLLERVQLRWLIARSGFCL